MINNFHLRLGTGFQIEQYGQGGFSTTRSHVSVPDHQFGATQSKNFMANSNPRKQAC